MESRWVIQILMGPVLKNERAAGVCAARVDEACFIEDT
jgi:hypothetical protein